VELEQVLARLAHGARQALEVDATVVCLLDEEGARLTVAAASGFPNTFRQRGSIALEQSCIDRQALSGAPVIVADAHADPRAVSVPGDYRSILCVPLAHAGDPVGTIRAYAAAPRCFGEGHAALLTSLADLGAAAVAATRALSALEALEASKAQFIRVATHELRSPVSVAQSLVRGVLKGYAGALTDKQAEVFGRISRRLDFLESLVTDLLDLAASKALGLAEEEAAVVLNSSVGRAVLLLQPRAEEKGVVLTHVACCEELVVWGTEEGLDRIFVNLVDNAIKYTPSGGSVTVSMRRVGDEIEVRVADTGIGIPEEALPRLFEEFYRAPNAKASSEVGTGLGLVIVRDLVEGYGGRVGVESRAGQGSTFSVTFPLLNWTEEK
jgi:signal transduction histidine kinase